MKKVLALLLLLPVLAYATTTQTTTNSTTISIAFSTGTEAAPTNDATLGIRLDGTAGCAVHSEAGVALTAGGVYQAYLFNPQTGNWTRVAGGELDLTVANVTKQSWPAIKVVSDLGRVVWIANGVGQASTLYVTCTAIKMVD